MIQQFMFACPRPGMTEAEFQCYWAEGCNAERTACSNASHPELKS